MRHLDRLSILSIALLPFINFSPLSSSGISFSLLGFLAGFVALIKRKRVFISPEAMFFLFFVLCLVISQIYSSSSVSNKYFSQIINYFLTFICFISFNSLASYFGKRVVYEYYFKFGLILNLVTFCFFIISYNLKSDAFSSLFFYFFNNSGSYSANGLNLFDGSFFNNVRMNLFFPEPSFYAMHITTLIGVGIIIKKPNYLIAMLLVFLFLTLGRTGIFATLVLFLSILFVRIFKPNNLSRGFIGIFLLIFPLLAFLGLFTFLAEFDASFFQRMDSINNALSFFQDSLFFGHGFDTYANLMRASGFHSGGIFNYPLQLMVSAGLVGFIPFIFFIFSIFYSSSQKEFPILCSIMTIISTIPAITIYFLIFIMAVSK